MTVVEKLHPWVVLQRRMKKMNGNRHHNRISVSMKAEYPICSGELPLLASLQPVRYASASFWSSSVTFMTTGVSLSYQNTKKCGNFISETLTLCYHKQGQCPMNVCSKGVANVWSRPFDLLSREVYTFLPRRYFYLIEFLNETQFVEIETKQLRLCASDSISDISRYFRHPYVQPLFELINLQRGRSRKLAIHPINGSKVNTVQHFSHASRSVIGCVLVYIKSDSLYLLVTYCKSQLKLHSAKNVLNLLGGGLTVIKKAGIPEGGVFIALRMSLNSVLPRIGAGNRFLYPYCAD
ncbi:hypothetical protein T10_1649 [Trichinella papuae]|uniref:Uncharacterized protein n=1 Tax=Trichinella papuae TaxID=268474 RepID=A0A0V1MX79_9BILA|nr:hypothetical protein T10_1649 [Trichinella papuae]